MNSYAKYVKERHGWECIERGESFVLYNIRPPDASIEELYVSPAERGTGLAQILGEEVETLAKAAGAKNLWTRVVLGTGGAERSMVASLKFGFKLALVSGSDIILRKEIGG